MWIWIANKLQNFTQKHSSEMKIFLKVLGGLLFWNTRYVAFRGSRKTGAPRRWMGSISNETHSRQLLAAWRHEEHPANIVPVYPVADRETRIRNGGRINHSPFHPTFSLFVCPQPTHKIQLSRVRCQLFILLAFQTISLFKSNFTHRFMDFFSRINFQTPAVE